MPRGRQRVVLGEEFMGEPLAVGTGGDVEACGGRGIKADGGLAVGGGDGNAALGDGDEGSEGIYALIPPNSGITGQNWATGLEARELLK
jgi:hypothetical protein